LRRKRYGKISYFGSYASDLMLWIFNDMINTGYDIFRLIGLLVVKKRNLIRNLTFS
jgi:hypothetical protein